MTLVCEKILKVFFSRLDSLGVPFGVPFGVSPKPGKSCGILIDDAVSKVEKLLIGNGSRVIQDSVVGKGRWEGGLWCGSYPLENAGGGSTRKTSFLQWPPAPEPHGWHVRLEFVPGHGYSDVSPRIPPELQNGGWLVVTRTFYNRELQDPPQKHPAVVAWVINPSKSVFKKEEIHYSRGLIWNPEKNKPAMTQYNELGEVIFHKHYVAGKCTGAHDAVKQEFLMSLKRADSISQTTRTALIRKREQAIGDK